MDSGYPVDEGTDDSEPVEVGQEVNEEEEEEGEEDYEGCEQSYRCAAVSPAVWAYLNMRPASIARVAVRRDSKSGRPKVSKIGVRTSLSKRVWVPPHTRNGRPVNGYWRKGHSFGFTPDIADWISLKFKDQPGFTVHGLTGSEPTKGYSVAALPPLDSVIVPPDKSVRASHKQITEWVQGHTKKKGPSLDDKRVFLGGWLDEDTGEIFLDIVKVFPPDQLDEAMSLGEEMDQRAIFDLGRGEEISVGGTGIAKADRRRGMLLILAPTDIDPGKFATELLRRRGSVSKEHDGDGDGFVNDGKPNMRPRGPQDTPSVSLPSRPKMLSLGSSSTGKRPGKSKGRKLSAGDTDIPDPGETPAPDGMVRLYHYTGPDNLESILDGGLNRSKARGDNYLEPNMIWASAEQPEPDATYVEFFVSPLDLDIGSVPRNSSPEVIQEQVDFITERHSDVTLLGDTLEPESIVTFNTPTLSTLRYLRESDYYTPDELRDLMDRSSTDPIAKEAIRLRLAELDVPSGNHPGRGKLEGRSLEADEALWNMLGVYNEGDLDFYPKVLSAANRDSRGYDIGNGKHAKAAKALTGALESAPVHEGGLFRWDHGEDFEVGEQVDMPLVSVTPDKSVLEPYGIRPTMFRFENSRYMGDENKFGGEEGLTGGAFEVVSINPTPEGSPKLRFGEEITWKEVTLRPISSGVSGNRDFSTPDLDHFLGVWQNDPMFHRSKRANDVALGNEVDFVDKQDAKVTKMMVETLLDGLLRDSTPLPSGGIRYSYPEDVDYTIGDTVDIPLLAVADSVKFHGTGAGGFEADRPGSVSVYVLKGAPSLEITEKQGEYIVGGKFEVVLDEVRESGQRAVELKWVAPVDSKVSKGESVAVSKRGRKKAGHGPNPRSTPKEIVGSHGHKSHGRSILWPALYEHLRLKGHTKKKAAMISNGKWRLKHGLPPKSVPGTKGKVKIPDVDVKGAALKAGRQWKISKYEPYSRREGKRWQRQSAGGMVHRGALSGAEIGQRKEAGRSSGASRQGPQRPAPQRPAPQRPAPQRPAPQRPAPQRPAPQPPAPQRPLAPSSSEILDQSSNGDPEGFSGRMDDEIANAGREGRDPMMTFADVGAMQRGLRRFEEAGAKVLRGPDGKFRLAEGETVWMVDWKGSGS